MAARKYPWNSLMRPGVHRVSRERLSIDATSFRRMCYHYASQYGRRVKVAVYSDRIVLTVTEEGWK